MRQLLPLALAGALLAPPASLQAAPADYPTEAVSDYVFGCMASNGSTQDALRRCSCSIDRIADALSWDDYVKAETVLRMRLVPSGADQMVMFRSSAWAQEMVDKLRKAQIDAEFQCF